jgi:two-component system sensor histidine kinase/response regulator
MPTPSSAETVLVVDDQDQNLQVVGTLLCALGYSVVPAKSAEQALERMRARPPDLILLDMIMPGKDGLSFCQELREDPVWTDIPIIFLSAAGEKNLVVQALEAGGVDYITKPFNKAELLSRVRAHIALKVARDRLRELAEDKDELLGILAHDLKNHLAGMRLSAGLLRDRSDEFSERSAELVANIVSSTDRVIAFVKEFLANQGAEHLQVAPRPLSLADEVGAAVQRHRDTAAEKQIQLVPILDATPAVLADPVALAQVLDNLIGNAVKFSHPHATVTVRVPEPASSHASFTVEDEGPGFTPEDRKRLFRRYGRLSARPTAGEPSTGLGLSIVKRLVEAMGGRIALDEGAEKGARFQIRLPLAADACGSAPRSGIDNQNGV